MNADQRYALGLLAQRHYNVWAFAGPANAQLRKIVMSKLLGRKCNQAQSGVTLLHTEFERLFPGYPGTLYTPDSCHATRERIYAEWALTVLAS